MTKLRWLTTGLLLVIGPIAVMAAYETATVSADCYFNCTTSTFIPGFPVESVGGGLLLGVLIILLLRGVWHIRRPMFNLINELRH